MFTRWRRLAMRPAEARFHHAWSLTTIDVTGALRFSPRSRLDGENLGSRELSSAANPSIAYGLCAAISTSAHRQIRNSPAVGAVCGGSQCLSPSGESTCLPPNVHWRNAIGRQRSATKRPGTSIVKCKRWLQIVVDYEHAPGGLGKKQNQCSFMSLCNYLCE